VAAATAAGNYFTSLAAGITTEC